MPAAAAVTLPSAAPAFPIAIWCPALTTVAIAASALSLPTTALALAAAALAAAALALAALALALAAAALAAAALALAIWHRGVRGCERVLRGHLPRRVGRSVQ